MEIEWLSASKTEGLRVTGEVVVHLEHPERLSVVSVEPVHVEGTAWVHDDTMAVDATIKATVVYRCVRCLTSFSENLETELHERFKRVPLSDEEEENEFIFTTDPAIQMDSYVGQELVLSLRQNPVCKEDCKGLCPVGGADLNNGECGCDRHPIDPRLEVLAQVLDNMESDSTGD